MTYTAAAAIKAARAEIGYRESGTNKTKYNDWLGQIPGYPHNGFGYPWCQSFQSWVAARAGGRANVDYPRTAGCLTAVAWFRGKGRFHDSPRVGDMVFYGPGGGTHVELVTKVTNSTITTVGGNTGGSLNGTYNEGNGVYEKVVSRSSSRIYGYGRPAYEGVGAAEEDDVDFTVSIPVGKTYDGDWNHPSYPASFMLVAAASYGKRANAALTKLSQQVAAQQATIDKLVDALASGQPVDLEALKEEIREAIGSIRFHLAADEDEPTEQPAQP